MALPYVWMAGKKAMSSSAPSMRMVKSNNNWAELDHTLGSGPGAAGTQMHTMKSLPSRNHIGWLVTWSMKVGHSVPGTQWIITVSDANEEEKLSEVAEIAHGLKKEDKSVPLGALTRGTV